jgi:hypothetical protein
LPAQPDGAGTRRQERFAGLAEAGDPPGDPPGGRGDAGHVAAPELGDGAEARLQPPGAGGAGSPTSRLGGGSFGELGGGEDLWGGAGSPGGGRGGSGPGAGAAGGPAAGSGGAPGGRPLLLAPLGNIAAGEGGVLVDPTDEEAFLRFAEDTAVDPEAKLKAMLGAFFGTEAEALAKQSGEAKGGK